MQTASAIFSINADRKITNLLLVTKIDCNGYKHWTISNDESFQQLPLHNFFVISIKDLWNEGPNLPAEILLNLHWSYGVDI